MITLGKQFGYLTPCNLQQPYSGINAGLFVSVVDSIIEFQGLLSFFLCLMFPFTFAIFVTSVFWKMLLSFHLFPPLYTEWKLFPKFSQSLQWLSDACRAIRFGYRTGKIQLLKYQQLTTKENVMKMNFRK